MPLSAQELRNLYSLAKDQWIEAESTRIAYDRRYETARQQSEWLKLFAVLFACLTTLSSVFDYNFLNLPITTIAASGTAIIAIFDKMYAPESKATESYSCSIKFAKIKNELATAALRLRHTDSIEDGTNPINQIAREVTEIRKLPVSVKPGDKEQALSAFTDTTIDHLISQIEAPAEPIEGDGQGLAEDAPGVVAVSRAGAA